MYHEYNVSDSKDFSIICDLSSWIIPGDSQSSTNRGLSTAVWDCRQAMLTLTRGVGDVFPRASFVGFIRLAVSKLIICLTSPSPYTTFGTMRLMELNDWLKVVYE